MKDIAPDKHKKEGVEEKEDGGVYSTMTQDVNVFSWGWAVNKDRGKSRPSCLPSAKIIVSGGLGIGMSAKTVIYN